jgi:hypothetical protein
MTFLTEGSTGGSSGNFRETIARESSPGGDVSRAMNA